MSTLSANQVAVYAQSAGFPPGSVLIDAVSVAMAESSGVTDVVNPEGNTGLWQVGPKGTRNDAGVGLTSDQLKDPGTNARAAFAIWTRDGRTFAKSWSTWGQGPQVAWAAKLHAGDWGAPSVSTPPLTDRLLSPLSSVADAIPGVSGIDAIAVDADKVGKWITTPSNWVRVLLVLVGGVLAVAGLNAVAKPVTRPVVDAGKKTAESAAKVAAVAAL